MITFFSSKPLAQNESIVAVIRIVVGLLMLYHGLEIFDSNLMHDYSNWEQLKKLPFSLGIVYIGKALELIIGVCFVLGFFTRIAALFMIIEMICICFYLGNGKFWYEDQHPFLFVLIGIIYYANGSGKWSLDRFWGKK